MLNILDPEFRLISKSFAHTGSRVICDPAPMDTDDDYVAYTELSLSIYKEVLKNYGWEWTNNPDNLENYDDTYPPGFTTWRKGELNLVITNNLDFYCKFVAATYVAKGLNLKNKEDRIELFSSILYEDTMGIL